MSLKNAFIRRVLSSIFSSGKNALLFLSKAGVSLKGLIILFFVAGTVGTGISLHYLLPKSTNFTSQQVPNRAVLGSSIALDPNKINGNIVFNIPANFNNNVTIKGLTVSGDETIQGNLTLGGKNLDVGQGTVKASNLLYGITAGSGIGSSGGHNPTISNTGVLSLQGLTGAVTLTAGSGISISGTTITNSSASNNTFSTVKVGSTSISAGSSTDALTLAAGTGVTLSTDTTNKIVTITNSGGGGGGSVNFGSGVTGTLGVANGGTGLTSFNAGDLLYASGATTLSTLGIGGTNSVLTSSGTAPAWSNSLTLSGLTVNGSLTVGNSTSQTITPTARFAGSLIPSSADTIDLGSSSLEFGNVYAKNIISPSTGGTSGYLQLNSGVLSPVNITNDFAIGGISTSSAKFQVTGSGAISQATGITSSGNIDFSGLGTGVVHSTSGVLSTSPVALGSEVSGQLGVANGGTGNNTFTTNGLLYGNGTSSLQVTSAGTNGQVLEANNLGVPTWSSLSVSAGSGGGCTNCLSLNPSTTQIINPTGSSTTGLSIAQTSTISPTGDIFNVTNSTGATKYLQIDSNGNTSVGGNVSFTNSASTTLGTSVANAWTLNGNSFNNRRSIAVTNADPTNTLSINYEVTLSFTGATATDICSKTRSDNNDLRISYGTSTEIARNITTRNCNTTLTVTFLLQTAIAPNGSDTYYIYYNNSSLNSAGPTYVSSTSVVDNADVVGNFTTSDSTYTPITQDTSNKQQGTGSVKVAIKGGTPGIVPPISTGADGTFDLSLGGGAGGCSGTGLSWNAGTSTCTINDTTKSTFNFTTINIPSGTTVTETNTTAVPELLATGTVTIAGTINLNSTGNPSGTGPGAGTSCVTGSCSTTTGGGSYGGAGGAASSGLAAGSTYTGINFGSAAGYNGYEPGGAGGGGIQIASSGNLTMSGTVNATGGVGQCFGSACTGGGSGGGVMLEANNLTVSGTINASGGNGGVLNGGNYGGAGGGGRIYLNYISSITTVGSTLTVSGGTTGFGGAGSSGSSVQQVDITSINQTVITTKSAMDLSTYGAVCFDVYSDTTGQYVQFGFGKTSITEQTYNINLTSPNTWSQQCFNIASLSVSARQNITKFGFTITNVPSGNMNFWFDYIVAQTTAGFSGSAPTLNTGATLLGTTNLTLNGQGLGGVKLNYDPTNGLAGTGGLTIYNGSSTSLFSVDGSGNSSQSGNLTFTGTSDVLGALNGAGLSFQTSVGGGSGLTTRMTLLNNGNFGIGTTTPGSLLDIIGGTVGIGTTSPLATLDVRGNSFNTPGASISGAFGKAALVVDNSGIGDIFTASSSGLNRFVISQSGNVGIGTATPTRNLDIVGNAVNNSNGTASQLSIYGASSSSNRLNIGYNTTSNYGWIEAVNQNSAWQNLYLQPTGGSVGINTTAANAELSLGTGVQTNKLYLLDNTSDKYGFGVATNTLQIYSGAGAGTSAAITFGKYDGTTFTEFMRLQNGNLGINTGANPTASLDVKATSFTTPVGNFSGSTGVASLIVNNTSSGDIFSASSSGVTKFVVTNSGVGIGKAVPGASLDVAGNLNVSTYATVSASLAVGTLSAPSGVGNAVFSGQVGIGTSTPTQALSVAGNESIYNSATGRGDISTTTNLDKTWNTTSLFNSAGTTFSAGMQNPATNNQINLSGPNPTMLNGWAYRKAITVNNTGNSSTLSNYQVKITMDTASLVTATKLKSDCSDLRFTDSNGQTLLNYWIESGCNTSSTIIWVKVPSITASSNYTIYAYYGDSSATAVSSSSSTFVRSISNVQLAYRLDEATATTATDYSGNGFNGTSTGTTVVTGPFGNARSFNGSSDYINVPTSATLNSGTFTFVAWIKQSNSSTYTIIGSSSNNGPQWRVLSGGKLDLVKEGAVDMGQSAGTLAANTWTHVAVTYDGTSYTFYINGVFSGSGSNVQTFTFSNYWVGRGFGGGEYMNGSIDEARIYNKVLSAAEISDLYNNYGYVTTNSANTEYVRAYSSPEPSTSVGIEASGNYQTGLQSWTSDTLDAGSGNTYKPSYLTVNYTLDGSDNIYPKFQVEGSNTGAFSGEQTVYPGSSSYYQSGSSYPITSGTQLDISSSVTSRFRYWKVIGYMDTGSIVTDTPIISSIRLQDNQVNISLFANGNVGIGNTNAAFKLDVQDGQSATVAAMIRNVNNGSTASGLGIALGANTPGTGNYFLSFLDGKGEIIGKVQGNGSAGVTYNTGGADFAEYFQKQNTSEALLPGKIVCQGVSGVTGCTGGQKIVGVVSGNAGFVGAGNHDTDPNYLLVGLIGQLPVNFSTASGTINPGDSITSDSQGNAIKATGEGQVVGTAIQGSDQSTNGKILINVNISWYNPSYSSTLGASVASLSSQLQQLPLFSTQDATVSGKLYVMGRTTLTDLGVTGDIQTGILAVHGIQGEIDTLGGSLKLEANNVENVDIENGKVIIDPLGNITSFGNITAQKVTVQNITAGTLTISNPSSSSSATVLSASTGVATLPAGQTMLTIQTTAVAPNARIFVTPQIPVAVGAVVTGPQAFTITIGSPENKSIQLNWWIVQ